MVGPYNMLLGQHPLYDAKNESYDTANEIFKHAFSEGFPWEARFFSLTITYDN